MCNKGEIKTVPSVATATGNSTSTTVTIDHGAYLHLSVTSTSIFILLVVLVLICFIIYSVKHKTNWFQINNQLNSIQDWIELEENQRRTQVESEKEKPKTDSAL